MEVLWMMDKFKSLGDIYVKVQFIITLEFKHNCMFINIYFGEQIYSYSCKAFFVY
jgi:hypothetical protein